VLVRGAKGSGLRLTIHVSLLTVLTIDSILR